MATGEVTRSDRSTDLDAGELPVGAAVTNSGRVSMARMYEPPAPNGPFNAAQLARLDEALTLASRESALEFSIYLGELGEDSRKSAEALLDSLGEPAERSVLIAVSPGERVVEVVTGAEARHRVADRGAKLAVMSMVASFKEGDLIGGLVSGLRMMTDQAGPAPKD